ncbi:MAG: hypothetical protein AABX65_01305 [Nanoarchaeota archaeon]
MESEKNLILNNTYVLTGIVLVVILIFLNQIFLMPKAFSTTGGAVVNLGKFEYGSKITLKPVPLSVGESPAISGYGSIVKALPTISELAITSPTGDAVQDLLNNVVPKGTPSYGGEAGVTFDDPVSSQQRLKSYLNLELSSAEEDRWGRIVNSFTCDYCCGSPQRPTIITNCGCAHSYAAQGLARWFVKNYGDRYSDEEIYGEMARWYALWYPKGTIERIIQEASV